MNLVMIGIDTGVKTGFAYSENGELQDVSTETILTAQDRVLTLLDCVGPDELLVCIEDVRKRKWVDPKAGRERLQGIGSVKRDCSIWQEFCEHHDIKYLLIPPANIPTKLSAKRFKELTGWTKRTSEHGRDAGMMITKYYRLIQKGMVALPESPNKDTV